MEFWRGTADPLSRVGLVDVGASGLPIVGETQVKKSMARLPSRSLQVTRKPDSPVAARRRGVRRPIGG
jgi:hypothetical protein